jgi:tRNA threonylcarbamoyladenosine biosynthesis protein TsaB
MLVLGMSTSTPQVGVAIGGHEGVLASWHAVRGRHHAELLTPAIAQTCESAGRTLDEIGVVAVDVGPGLFTGLRVGVATAKAVATALGVPMIGVSSLDLSAFALRYACRPVTAAIDARRGELFVASYVTAAELMAGAGEHLLVGDGARRYAEVLGADDRVELADAGVGRPSADALVQLAHAQALREEWVSPTEIRCTYLRQPDAEINWQTRDGGVTA